MLIECAVDVGENSFGRGLTRGQVMIAVGKNFRFNDGNQTGLLADGSISIGEGGAGGGTGRRKSFSF